MPQSTHAEFELLQYLAVFGARNVLLIVFAHLPDPISCKANHTVSRLY